MTKDLEIKVKLATGDLQKGIADSRELIKSLGKEKASIIIDLKKEALQEDFAKIKADLKSLSDPANIRPITFVIDKQKLEENIAQVKASLDQLKNQKITPEIKIEQQKAKADLDTLQGNLKKLDATKTSAQIQIEKEKALTDLAGIKTQLKSLDKVKIDIEVPKNTALELRAIAESFSAISGVLTQLKNDAVAAFKEFDAAKTKLITIGDSGKALAGELRGLSKELGYQASSAELANGGYTALSGGFTKSGESAKILKAATVGAVGGFSDADKVTKALVATLNAYGGSADQASTFVDKFSSVQQNGIITIDEYSGQIAKIAPIAAQAGVGLDELNGFIATATASGVPAEQVFSGLRQAIASTLKPSSEASKLAQELGISFDAQALKTKGLAGILGDLRKSGKDTAENLVQLFGSVEAVSAIAPSAGAGFQKLRANIASSADSAGLAAKNFDTVANSVGGRAKALQIELNESLSQFGEKILAVTNPVVQGTIAIVRAFNGLPQPVQAAIAIFVGGGAAVAAFGAAVATIAAIATPTVAGLTLISGAAGTLTTFLGGSVTQLFNFSGASKAAAVDAATVGVAAEGASVGFGTMAASIGLAIAQLALLYLAFEALKTGLDIGALFLGINDGTKAIDELRESLGQTNQVASESDNIFGIFFDGLVSGADRAKGPLEAIAQGFINLENAIYRSDTSGIDKFGNSYGLVSAAQIRAQQTTIAFGKQIEAMNPTLDKGQALLSKYGLAVNAEANASKLSADQKKSFKEDSEKQVKLLQQEISALQKLKSQKDIDQDTLKAQIAVRESYIKSFQTRIGLVDAEAKAVAKGTSATKENTKALKEQADEQAKLAKAKAEIDLAAKAKKQSESRQEIEKNKEKKIETTRDKAVDDLKLKQEKEIANFKLAQENILGDKKRTFEKEIATFKEGRELDLRNKQRDFEKAQNLKAEAFRKSQEIADEAYQKKKQANEKAFQDSLNGAKGIIDREAAIGTANPEEQEKLKKKFAEEDRIRQQVQSTNVDTKSTKAQFANQAKSIAGVTQIKDAEDAAKVQFALAELEAKVKLKFAEEERAADKAHKESERLADKAFKDAQDTQKIEYETKVLAPAKKAIETEIEARKVAFEKTTIQPLKLKQEADLALFKQGKDEEAKALKLKFEGELDILRKNFKLAEIDLDTKAQKARLDREAIFKDQQRTLDLENAKQVAAILQSATVSKLGSAVGIGGKIPKFSGGIQNFGGGLAFVHAGEVLMNLSQGTSVIPANKVGSLGGGGNVEAMLSQIVAKLDRPNLSVTSAKDPNELIGEVYRQSAISALSRSGV